MVSVAMRLETVVGANEREHGVSVGPADVGFPKGDEGDFTKQGSASLHIAGLAYAVKDGSHASQERARD